MATIYPIPPAIAALFARRVVTPVRPVQKASVVKPAAITAQPNRNRRRGSLLDLLV